MNYTLRALVLQPNPKIPLTQEEFEVLRGSRLAMTAAFTLEEIFDLVLANFNDLEVSVLHAAVSEMTRWQEDYQDYFETRSGFNRRTLNLLSATRLYLDQFPQWLREVGADPEPIRKLTNQLYDTHFEYRFMEALRNHVQHVGLAVHGVNVGSKWLPEGQREHLEFSVSPYTSRSSLEVDKGFKPSVLAECPEKVSVIQAARVYVESLSTLHQEVRKLVLPLTTQARQNVEAAILRHQEVAKARIPGLAAVASENGKIAAQVPLFLDWDDVRLKLIKKNHSLRNLSRSYVSSQVRK